MKLDILSIIILLAYTYIMLCVLKTNELTEMSLLTLLLVLYFYINQKHSQIEGYNINENYAQFASTGCSGSNCNHGGSTKPEVNPSDNIIENISESVSDVASDVVQDLTESNDVSSKPSALHINDKMSNYDGICLKTGNLDSWMKSPSDIQLNSNDGLYTIQGGTAPVKPVFSDPTSLQGPPLDGIESSPHKLFMLANNKVSPECCPSTFSTSTGCVCSTHQQREYIKHRGNNVSGCNVSI
jgi:hypothetical protein